MAACDSVQLPTINGSNLSGAQGYYSGPGGTGTRYNVGDWITSSMTPMYIYDSTATSPSCFDEELFNITITNTPEIDDPGNMTACDSIQLPSITGTNLTGDQAYYTGTNGTGTRYNPGDWVTTSVTPMYIYDTTATAPSCTDELTFNITINPTPVVSPPFIPSECENVPGSGQALNLDVTALEPSIDPTGTFVWYTDNTYATPFNPISETVDSGEVFYFEVTVNGCPYRDRVVYNVSGNINLNDPLPEFCEDVSGGGSVSGIDLTTFNNGVFAGATTYTWATGPTGVTINDGDSIQVDVQQGSCPVVSVFVHFTVNPLPTANMTVDTLCDDGSGLATFNLAALNTIVNGGAGNNVAWYTDGTLTTQITPANAFLTGSTKVVALVTNPTTGCTDTASVDLTVVPTPVINNPGNMTACDSVQLPNITGTNLTGNAAYYTGTGGTGTRYSVGDWITTNVNPMYIYDTTVTTPSCTDEESFNITINPTPTVNTVLPVECENIPGSDQALNVDVTGLETALNPSGTFVWYTDNTYSSPFNPISETVDNGEVFYFEITINGCTLQDSITYSVGDNISLTDPMPEFCEDTPGSGSVSGIDLTTFNNAVFPGATTYTWGQGPTGVTINDGDSIQVFVQQGSCPSVNIYVHFTVNPLPTANPTSMEMCDDGSGQGTFDLTTLNSTVNGGSNDTVSWFTDPNLTTPVIPENGYMTGTTTVYAQVTDTATGCSGSASVTLTVNALPTIASTNMSVCDDGSGQGTFDLTTLNTTVNGGTSNTVIWYTDNTLLTMVAPDNAYLTGSTTVYAQVTDTATGCSDTVSVQLTVDPQSSINVIPTESICLGDPLTLIATGSGSGVITWYSDAGGTAVLDTGSFTPVITGPGVYTFYVREEGGCPSSMDSIVVTVGAVTAQINANPTTGLAPLTVFFGNGSTTGNNITYSWDFGNGNTSTDFEPSSVYDGEGTYTAMLIVTDGICYDTAYVDIIVDEDSYIFIPNIFTPNGDGHNDYLTIKSRGIVSLDVEIYNRWGQFLYSWTHLKGKWDGRTLAGNECPDGTYFYIVKAVGKDGKEYFKNGSFNLIR
jgi:gliding motility-associated-like protein